MNTPTLASQFLINPKVTFLNFGSFGACPKPIFEDLHKWQLELETEPVQFITVDGYKYLKQSREALAKYIHCDADDVVYTPNPSYAMSIITKSLKLNPGDKGTTLSMLRPMGTVLFGAEKVEVQSELDTVAPNKEVVITRIVHNKIFVKAVE